jgi:hypothetical protein
MLQIQGSPVTGLSQPQYFTDLGCHTRDRCLVLKLHLFQVSHAQGLKPLLFVAKFQILFVSACPKGSWFMARKHALFQAIFCLAVATARPEMA